MFFPLFLLFPSLSFFYLSVLPAFLVIPFPFICSPFLIFSAQYVVSILFPSVCYFLITRIVSFDILFMFVFLFCMFVVYFVYSVLLYCFAYTWCVQVLRSPKEAFAAAMQSWRERCEKCVCLQGDYVEK